MTTEEFSYWFDKIEGVQVIKLDTDKVYFSLGSENLIKKITKTSNLSDNFLSLHDDKEGIIFVFTDINLINLLKYGKTNVQLMQSMERQIYHLLLSAK